MIQEIIVYVILFAILVWLGNGFYKRFISRTSDPCNGCSSSCGSCPVGDLKKEIEMKKLNREEK